MSLLVKARPTGRTIVEVTPASAGWRYVGFAAYRLAPGDALDVDLPGRETCTVVLSGRVSAQAGAQRFDDIGDRTSVFDDAAPYAVYAPAGQRVRIVAHTAAEIGVASAPGAGAAAAGSRAGTAAGAGARAGDAPDALGTRLIDPATMKRSTRGKGSNTRYVCDILPESEPAASLLVVEVRTPSGHSSSYPPHKHDRDALPEESALEETYYHRLDPPQGFAFQRVYTDDRSLDESLAVENQDVVMVPRGYHPVVVPHGYESYYLNVMAGPKREWHFHNDPAHEWMLK
jgi:5-deoxy-glucuronate isomerase